MCIEISKTVIFLCVLEHKVTSENIKAVEKGKEQKIFESSKLLSAQF